MAIASAMVSYIAAGAVGILMYTRGQSIEWGSTAVVLVAAAPASFCGSYFLKHLSDIAIKLVLYACACMLAPTHAAAGSQYLGTQWFSCHPFWHCIGLCNRAGLLGIRLSVPLVPGIRDMGQQTTIVSLLPLLAR